MEKPTSDKSIKSFVMRNIRKECEPLISILKVLKSDEENITLINLMTGFSETVDMDEYLMFYKPINETTLEVAFAFAYDSHKDLLEGFEFDYSEEIEE